MEKLHEKFKEMQERINKGEVKIISLGVINGIHRYKFIETKEGANENES